MPASQRRHLTGRIILVQEDRFRIVDGTGRGYLLGISYKAGLGQEDLERFHEADAQVRVEYTGEPNLASGIAHNIEPL